MAPKPAADPVTERPVTSALLHGLASGEVVILPDAAGLSRDDAIVLVDDGPDRIRIAPPYDRWSEEPVEGTWSATVVAVEQATAFEAHAFASRHLVARHPGGSVAVLRVSTEAGPVLSDVAFSARLRSIEGARR